MGRLKGNSSKYRKPSIERGGTGEKKSAVLAEGWIEEVKEQKPYRTMKRKRSPTDVRHIWRHWINTVPGQHTSVEQD